MPSSTWLKKTKNVLTSRLLVRLLVAVLAVKALRWMRLYLLGFARANNERGPLAQVVLPGPRGEGASYEPILKADSASGQELGQEAPSSGNMNRDQLFSFPSSSSSSSSSSTSSTSTSSASSSSSSSSSTSSARVLPEFPPLPRVCVDSTNNEVVEAKQHEWFEGSREWLFEEVRQWLHSGKRLCWLVGGAGTGKSVVSARLLLTEGVREHVKAWHFCRHDNAAGSDVRVILQSWSAMLANNLAGFEAVSLALDGANQAGAGAIVESKGQAVAMASSLSAREMFKLLIADPLARMETKSLLFPLSSSPSSPPCVIVLDALDELPRGSVNDVLQLLAEEFGKLPSCVRLFVASRDEALISKHLARFEKVKLEVNEVRNRADLRMYLAQVARRHVTLEQGMADLETRMEREFKLAPFRLRGEFRGLRKAMGRCKDIYAAAVAKLQQQTSNHNNEDVNKHYRAICNIRDFKPNDSTFCGDGSSSSTGSRQCVADLNELFQDAEEAHQKLKHLLFANKKLLVDELIDPGLKSRDSALRKTNIEYKGDFSRLKDLTRFTALFSSCERMRLFVESLSCGREAASSSSMNEWPGVVVVALKNKYSSPSVLGHRDLNLTLGVELASGRVHLCELQVNVVDMMTAARLTHVFYEEVRVKIPEICERAGIKDHAELFKAKLSKMLRSSVLEAAVNELERKAEGLFLYASLLARHLETMEHKVDFTALQGLPSGLSEIYEMNFARLMTDVAVVRRNVSEEGEEPKQKEQQEQWLAYSRLISMVVAAREPLPVVLAREMVGVGCEEMEQALSLLFPVREGRFQVMHKSVADWLQDSERKSLFVINKADIQAAHQSMGQYFHHGMQQPTQFDQQASDFCVRHVVYHLCMAGLWDEVYAVVSSVEGWLLPRAQMNPLGMVEDLELAASFADSPHRSTIRLMGQAMRMDLDEVRHDYRTLAGRLVGRLMGHESKEVQELLAEVRKWRGPPEGWWCPMQPTLAPAGGSLVTILHLEGIVRCIQWNPGNANQMVIAEGKKVHIYEVSSGRCIHTLEGHSSVVNSVSWSSDGGRICSGGSVDKTVRVWDVASGQCIHTLEGHSSYVNSVSWSSDGSRICSGSRDKTVRVWDVSSGQCIHTLEGHSSNVHSVSWSSDGSSICSGSDDKTVRVWDVSSGQCIHTLGHSSDVHSVSWSSDNAKICSGSDTVRVWNVSSGQCVHTFKGHSSYVNSVSWSSDDSRICSGSHDNTVRVWDVSSGQCIHTLEGHSSVVDSVSWSSDGNRICSGSWDKTVRVWDVSSGRCIHTLEGHSSDVTSLSWSSDGSRICSSGSEDKTVRVWDVSSGRCIHTLEGHSSFVHSVSWSSDGSRICSGSLDKTVRVWDVPSGQCIHTLEGHCSNVTSVSWSSDGSSICSGSRDNTVRVWDVASGRCIHTLEGHSSDVHSVSWSSDGNRICSGSWDKTVRVWDVSSGRCIRTLKGHSFVNSVSWSSDGSRICSGSWDNAVRVWDVSSGQCIHILEGHSSQVTSVSWSDGSRICSGSWNNTVRVWDVASGRCIQTLFGHILPSNSFCCAPPVGFTLGPLISMCPTNLRLAVALEYNVIHCLCHMGCFP